MLSTDNPFGEPFPETQFFTARDGARIAFAKLGKTSKDDLIPPIIMVNGLSMIKKDFLTSIAPVLALHTAVAVFDNRGLDESKLPPGDPPFSVEDMAHDTLELAQRLGWAGGPGFALVGVSLGGKIALAAAPSLQRESKRFNPRLA
ncbi:alpha/beta-hydrolase [Gonapodya prolifera JEL478]|uniref:Alpha/beta-hydrolase n=1 Tax=Gonapodya prolifera (strain JEL478) TaxID=1344416 RepID=A0A139ADQ6_GONPJ|nr:alpha/beta-hydrolase [Gonapodya prolifera JEL478]|eukprot:KXS14952.1 alpha/beta-hydrolase [Gonapodya prolifera JEL478]